MKRDRTANKLKPVQLDFCKSGFLPIPFADRKDGDEIRGEKPGKTPVDVKDPERERERNDAPNLDKHVGFGLTLAKNHSPIIIAVA